MTHEFASTIKDLPLSERPQERMIGQGPAALSDAELLALLLRTGTPKQNVIELSRCILQQYPLPSLAQISLGELQAFSGISQVKACQITACIELSKRLSSPPQNRKTRIATSEDVAMLLSPHLRYLTKEHFIGLYLDTRNCLIKKEEISVGSLNTSVAHPREIFRTAITESANAVIIAHNHPSGDPSPSKEDIEVTRRLERAGLLVGIPLLDHVVIGHSGHTSLRDLGLFGKATAAGQSRKGSINT